ncbi:hypothetical protein BN14_09797 [Rhizoctonia solani AG-1 IB]|uniref:Uncharacterized protein n=1 Tax=Thanatephorus cucumeris (strain AG1-IB / isolate 7/3/14) TaxID=1108050 RepID=M5C8M4_THACB|nr:hypothetical protein BN14_09797 [Rhizoctonia solani AG-1 IB]
MKDNLSSAANIIHVLLKASNRCNIQCIRLNTYKHPRWGFMYWLDPKGKEGPQLFYGWHCQGFLTLPHVISAALSATELCAAFLNFVLLYPANSSTVPVSSPVSANALSNLEESLARPAAGATLLPSLQSSANSPPAQGLWQAPAPATEDWQPFS